MGMGKLLVAVAAFVGSALASGEASAAYVCSVAYFPGPTGAGNEGSVSLSVNTGPDCTGSVVGNYYLCTAGGSVSSCPSNSIFRYDRTGLLAMFGALQRAASENQRIQANVTSMCSSGGTSCLASVIFYSE